MCNARELSPDSIVTMNMGILISNEQSQMIMIITNVELGEVTRNVAPFALIRGIPDRL